MKRKQSRKRRVPEHISEQMRSIRKKDTLISYQSLALGVFRGKYLHLRV